MDKLKEEHVYQEFPYEFFQGAPDADYDLFIREYMDYINQHLSEELSVRSLANMAYVSPDHLTRSFKKRFSMTVSDYILQRRMTLAGELLRDNKLTITMVSDCVGFGNYSYFTEQFKKYYGMTPREYQNSVRKT